MSLRTITNHDEIRQWVERHNGKPVVVRGTVIDDVLDILFSDVTDDFSVISWEEFFDRFESENLAFRYDDEINEVGLSWSMIPRESVPPLLDDPTSIPEINEGVNENIFPDAPANNRSFDDEISPQSA